MLILSLLAYAAARPAPAPAPAAGRFSAGTTAAHGVGVLAVAAVVVLPGGTSADFFDGEFEIVGKNVAKSKAKALLGGDGSGGTTQDDLGVRFLPKIDIVDINKEDVVEDLSVEPPSLAEAFGRPSFDDPYFPRGSGAAAPPTRRGSDPTASQTEEKKAAFDKPRAFLYQTKVAGLATFIASWKPLPPRPAGFYFDVKIRTHNRSSRLHAGLAIGVFIVPVAEADGFGEQLLNDKILDYAEAVEDLAPHLPASMVCVGMGYDGVLFHFHAGTDNKFVFEELQNFRPARDLNVGDVVGLHVSSNLVLAVNGVERVATRVLEFLDLEGRQVFPFCNLVEATEAVES